jgi:Kef-type K+ transport system membrane component KefB
VLALSPLPPLGGHELLIFLLDVGVLLLAAVLLGQLATRLKLPAIAGELVAGILLGPSLLGHAAPGLSGWLLPHQAEQLHLVDAVGQIGVLLLVGITGMQLDFGMVRRRGATAARVSIPGLVIPLGLGIGAGYLLPASLLAAGTQRSVFAVFLGVAMCVSAIPVIAKTLADMKLLHRDVGQLTLIAGTVDDTLGWLGLSIVSAMAVTGLRASSLARSIAFLIAFLAFAFLVGRPLVQRVIRLAGRSESGQPVAAAVVVVLLLSGATTQALGLEAVFGAFVAGIVIGTCRDLDRSALAPVRTMVMSILAPLFFATAGLRMDLTTLGHPVVAVAAVVLLLLAIAGKFAGAYLGARASRLSRWEALGLGAGMNARGVVQIIVANVGLKLGILTTATYTIIVLIAVVTSIMAAPILRLAMARVELSAEEKLRESAWADVLSPGEAAANAAAAHADAASADVTRTTPGDDQPEPAAGA